MVLTFIAHLLEGDYCPSGEDVPHFIHYQISLLRVGRFSPLLCISSSFFFKSLLNLLQYGFYVSVFWPWGMWDLSSSSPDEPTGSALDVVLTTGPPGDIPPLLYSYTIFFAPHLEHFITVLLLLLKWSLCVDLSLLVWGPSDPWEPSNSYHKEVLYRCWMKWKPCSLIT